jgi:anaerobic C4-dicarboxylate transporter
MEVELMRKALFLKIAIFVAVVGLFALPAVAQKVKTIGVDRDGEFHVYWQTKLGDKTIKTGMYRISHEFVDNEHFIVIRKVSYSRRALST